MNTTKMIVVATVGVIAGIAVGSFNIVSGQPRIETQTVEVKNDGRVVVTESKQVEELVFDGTLEELDARVASNNRLIAEMQAKNVMLAAVRVKMVAELNKVR